MIEINMKCSCSAEFHQKMEQMNYLSTFTNHVEAWQKIHESHQYQKSSVATPGLVVKPLLLSSGQRHQIQELLLDVPMEKVAEIQELIIQAITDCFKLTPYTLIELGSISLGSMIHTLTLELHMNSGSTKDGDHGHADLDKAILDSQLYSSPSLATALHKTPHDFSINTKSAT